MNDLRKAAQQALEAIDWMRLHLQRDHQCLHMDPAQSGIPAWISKSETTLRAALAEYDKDRVRIAERKAKWAEQLQLARETQERDRQQREYEEQRLAALAAPVQEPLTADETMSILNETAGQHWCDEAHLQRFRAAIERAHGIT